MSQLEDQKIPARFEKDWQLNLNSAALNSIIVAENKKLGEKVRINIKNSSGRIEETIKKHSMLSLSQYEFTATPYPGQLTEAVNCGKKFYPQLITDQTIDYYLFYVNDRFVLSVCDSDDFTYKMFTGFFTDEQNRLIVVDYFSKEANSPEIFFKKHFDKLTALQLDFLKEQKQQ